MEKTLLLIRPYGYHYLDIYVNELFSPFREVTVAAADIREKDWSWLQLKRVKLAKLKPKSVLGIDPFVLFREGYSLNSWASLEGISHLCTKVDIIDAAEVNSFFTFQAVKEAHALRKKIAIDVIETIPNHISSKIPPYSLLTKYCVEKADLLIARTERSREYLLSVGANEDKIHTIYPGIDTEMFNGRTEEHEGNFKVLFTGTLSESKGLLTLLSAFKRLVSGRNKDVELWLAGDGPLRHIIERLQVSIPIKLLGKVEWSLMPEIYRACDVFCFPSQDVRKFGLNIWEEQFGLSLVEAMSSKLAVIATKCGAIPEVLEDENMLIPQGSTDELFKKIELLRHDRELIRQLGVKNRNRVVKLFNARLQTAKYADVLNRYLS